jgi:hypothetical protein
MKHHNNSGDAASLAPSSQQQIPIPAAPVPAPRLQYLFNTRRDSAPTLPAAPQNITTLRSFTHASSTNRKVSNQRRSD